MSRVLVQSAHEIADVVLYPSAIEVDRTSQIPDTHWQSIADAGLYGIAVPSELGGPGLDLVDITEILEVIAGILEVIAGGCLATAFTWIQHHGALAALSASTNTILRDELVPPAAAGHIRAGVAFAGAVPVPPRMHAERVENGWRLSGHAPFVSGWGIIDVIQISAVDTDSRDIVAGMVPARLQPGITTVTPQSLSVADATKTVSIDIDGLLITDDRIVSRVPRTEFMANQNFGSRLNGTLPLGIVRRCAALLDEAGRTDAAQSVRVDAEEVRRRLDRGLGDSALLLEARADGAELALRASAALVASSGGTAILRSSIEQLLAREAMFTLVAASRPELKKFLVGRLAQQA